MAVRVWHTSKYQASSVQNVIVDSFVLLEHVTENIGLGYQKESLRLGQRSQTAKPDQQQSREQRAESREQSRAEQSRAEQSRADRQLKTKTDQASSRTDQQQARPNQTSNRRDLQQTTQSHKTRPDGTGPAPDQTRPDYTSCRTDQTRSQQTRADQTSSRTAGFREGSCKFRNLDEIRLQVIAGGFR